MTWRVPVDLWKGEPCLIIGGGPTVDREAVWRFKGRVIAVNNAYLLRPDADLLYFADRRWYDWHRDSVSMFQGPYIVTRQEVKRPAHNIKVVERNLKIPLSRSGRSVAGLCGGANALNLAFLFGCNPIILHGFDMRPGNWHTDHKVPQKPDFARRFIPFFERMAPELAKEGRTVINATPGSALDCFPVMSLDEAMVLS